MTPQELKNSILQLAIQGKLVEQRPEEGTAEELYQQIQAEKQRLIKEKKIKKDKTLPEITDEETPFEIPESWMWVRVGECISNRAGLAYKKGDLDIPAQNMVRVLRGGNIGNMEVLFKPDDVMISSEFVKPELYLKKNTIITPAVTSIDHIGKMGRIEQDYSDVVVGGFVLMLSPVYNDDTLSEYFLYAFSSKYFRDCCREIVHKSGQAFYNLSREKMMQIVIPLPPLAEQKRIVAKIEELLPLVDRYEAAWNRLEAFNKRFPEDMQKSILQEAIQGKLVEQRSEEGTGEELYQQIQAEKQQLIKEKKIKKEKPLPEIAEDEKPFEIPESWKWVRIGDIFNTSSGTTPSKSNPGYYTNGVYNWVRTTDLNNSRLTSCEIQISQIAFDECRLQILPRKSVCIAMYGGAGTIGKNAILEFDTTINQSVCAIHPNNFCDMRYLQFFIQYFRPHWMDFAAGSRKDPNINKVIIRNAIIPLPPLAEQKRIVAKIEELLPLCERLK